MPMLGECEVGSTRGLKQHVQTHEKGLQVLALLVVDKGFFDGHDLLWGSAS
jgi:hypothetical protein